MSDQQQPVEVQRWIVGYEIVRGSAPTMRKLEVARHIECEDGDWVRFDDYEQATANLKQRIEELEGELKDVRAENEKLRQQWGEDASPAMAVDEIEALTECAESAEQRLEETRGALADLVEHDGAGRSWLTEVLSPAEVVQRIESALAALDTFEQGERINEREELAGERCEEAGDALDLGDILHRLASTVGRARLTVQNHGGALDMDEAGDDLETASVAISDLRRYIAATSEPVSEHPTGPQGGGEQ